MPETSPERPAPRTRRDGDLVRDTGRAGGVGVAMLAVTAVLLILVALDVESPPFLQEVDEAWRRLVLQWPASARRVGELLEQAGAGVVMVPLRVVVAVWLALRRRRWDLAAWLGAWLVADLLTAVLKPGVGRERPTPTDPANPFTSFPSAHAKTAGQVAVGLVLLATSPWRSRRGWYALAAVWIVLMSLSRTVIDHHWLSDVVAGASLGAGASIAAAAAVQRLRDRRDSEPSPAPR